MAITERDRAILHWINKHGFATAEQIQKNKNFGFRTSQMTYRRLGECQSEKLLQKEKIIMSRPSVWWVTPAGAEMAESPLSAPGRPAAQNIEHDLGVVDLSMYLLGEMEKQGKKASWVSEREIKAAQMEKVAPKDKKAMFSVLASRVPDGVLQVDGVKMAIELELTLKSRSRIKKIVNDYALRLISGEYQSVVYYFAKNSVQRVLSEEIQNLSTAGSFQVLELPDELQDEKKEKKTNAN